MPTLEHRYIEQLRLRYGVEEDLDPGQASESVMALEDLGSGETPKEQGDSQEEPESRTDMESEIHQPDTGGHDSSKPNPRLPMRSEYGPHNPRKSQRSKRLPTCYR